MVSLDATNVLVALERIERDLLAIIRALRVVLAVEEQEREGLKTASTERVVRDAAKSL